MPWSRWRPFLIASAVVALMAVVIGVVAVQSDEPPAKRNSNSALIDVTVRNAPAKFIIRSVPNAPAGTIPGAFPVGDAVLINRKTGSTAGAVLHFTLDRTKLPAEAPDCTTPTTDVNMAIAVFNDQVQAWIPLETTCTGNELTATAPHFSLFRAWIVEAGEYTYHWMANNVQQMTKVVTKTTTPVIGYLGDLVKSVTATFFDNLLSKFEDSQYTCAPVSTKYTVDVQAAYNAAFHNNAITGCVLSASGETAYIRNSSAIPLAFGPQGGMLHLKPAPIDVSLGDISTLENAFAYARGIFLVPGLQASRFRIADNTPSGTKISGQMDFPSVLLELASAVLGVAVPEFKSEDTVMQQLMEQVNHRLIVIADQYGVTAVKPTDVTNAIRAVAKDNPNWASRLNGALRVTDMAKCLTVQDISAKGMVEAAFNCLKTVFQPDGPELKILLTALAGSAQAAPELIQATTATQFKALSGAGVTQVGVTVNKVFNADETYAPFVGDWAVRGSQLHLYTGRTGRMDISVGPCNTGANSPVCWQHLAVTVRVDPSGVVVTYGNFDVTDKPDGGGTHYPNSLASGAADKGDSYRLNLLHPGFMQLAGLTPHSQQILAGDKMCGKAATDADRQVCNI